jgi:hypothetical protein
MRNYVQKYGHKKKVYKRRIVAKPATMLKRIKHLEDHVNPAYKYIQQYTVGNVGSVPTFIELAPIVGEGIFVSAADNVRQQLNIKLNTTQLRFQVDGNPLSPQQESVCRFIVFKWDDNTFPTAADILNTTYISTGYDGFYNPHQRKYKILYDKCITIGNLIASNEKFEKYWQVKLKTNWVASFASNTGTSGTSGRIFLMTIGESNALPATSPVYLISSNVNFEG